MQRVIDEANYVLNVLRGMKEEVAPSPDSFHPDARQKIEKAIVRAETALEKRIRWSAARSNIRQLPDPHVAIS